MDPTTAPHGSAGAPASAAQFSDALLVSGLRAHSALGSHWQLTALQIGPQIGGTLRCGIGPVVIMLD